MGANLTRPCGPGGGYKRPAHNTLPPPNATVLPSRYNDGEISLAPPPTARAPVRAIWEDAAARRYMSGDTLRATRLPEGTYSVSLTDAMGASSCPLVVRVPSSAIPTVTAYKRKDASGDFAHDGEVTAVVKNVPDPSDVELLWTGSVTTIGTRHGVVLRGVQPGVYAALIVRVNGAAVKCLHAAEPITVRVKS